MENYSLVVSPSWVSRLQRLFIRATAQYLRTSVIRMVKLHSRRSRMEEDKFSGGIFDRIYVTVHYVRITKKIAYPWDFPAFDGATRRKYFLPKQILRTNAIRYSCQSAWQRIHRMFRRAVFVSFFSPTLEKWCISTSLSFSFFILLSYILNLDTPLKFIACLLARAA